LIRLADIRLGSVVGTGLLLASLPFYQSAEHRPIFDRWSNSFAGFALLVFLVWIGVLVRAATGHRKPPRASGGERAAGRLLELGVVVWGAAYLLSTVHSSESAGRVLDFNLIGSTYPAAVVLEWFAAIALLTAAAIRLAPLFHGRLTGPGLSLATTIGLLVLAEGVARGKAILAPAPMGFPTYSGEIWADRYVRLNSSGFRDVEHRLDRTNAGRRLLVVGDSYAFGWGVEDIEARFGEQLGAQFSAITGDNWEVLNASRGDTHTLQHIEFLEGMLQYQPDVVVLQYVFNDIDYLYPVTPRSVLAGGQSTVLQRLNPLLFLYRNSYAFQEALVRVRLLRREAAGADPYADEAMLDAHLRDVKRFVEIAQRSGARAVVVPFDIGVVAGTRARERYAHFVRGAAAAGIPLWSLEGAFDGMEYASLYVNKFDRHPNARAYRAAAEYVARQAAGELTPFRLATEPARETGRTPRP
jgi:hypothetical protein